MDHLASQFSGGDNPNKHKHKHSPKSSSELLSSAKLVASTFGGGGGKSDEADKGKAAGAAADLLCAASHYGNLEEKGLGKYVDKAEDYLHKYGSSHGSAPAAATGGQGHSAPAAATGGQGHSAPAAHKPSHDAEDGESGGGNGYGDYFKMAQGFLKK